MIYENFFDKSIKQFCKSNVILLFFIVFLPLLIFILLSYNSVISKENELLFSIIISSSVYYGSIIMTLFLYYKDWKREKEENSNLINFKIGYDFQENNNKKIYPITPESAFNDYNCFYGLQVKTVDKLEIPQYYGFGVELLNGDYEKIINFGLYKVFYSSNNSDFKEIKSFWGKRNIKNDILDYGHTKRDFIVLDKNMNIKADDKSTIILIYSLNTITKRNYFALYKIKFCKVAFYEKSLILDKKLYNDLLKKTNCKNFNSKILEVLGNNT